MPKRPARLGFLLASGPAPALLRSDSAPDRPVVASRRFARFVTLQLQTRRVPSCGTLQRRCPRAAQTPHKELFPTVGIRLALRRDMRWAVVGCLVAMQCFAGSSVRIAIIGDYGVDDPGQLAVANLIKTNFQPDFIVTAGDNNYLGESQIDRAIGKYFHEFIGNYTGSYGAGASSNRFFPALGNHDWYSGNGYGAHTDYFTLPGNKRYYDFVRGPVHVFVVNTDSHEPDGTSATSVQALWFSNRIHASTSPWRIVLAQDPPYSSTEAHAFIRWPFEEWGASIVISGDSHQYERIMRNGFPYVVNGAGGAGLVGFGTPIAGSVVRYHANHGAMLAVATSTNIHYEFWSIANGGTLIDEFTQSLPPLSASISGNSMVLSWPANGTDGFALEAAPSFPSPWTEVTTAPVINNGRKVVTLNATGTTRYFRLRR